MKIVLHIGAHKTATTYLQNRLSCSPALLAAHEMRFLGPAILRHTSASVLSSRLRVFIPQVGALIRHRIAQEIRRAERDGIERLIISEESLLGRLGSLRSGGPLYARTGMRLRQLSNDLAAQFAGHELTVLLGIRNYAELYASAIGHSIRRGRLSPMTERERQRTLEMPRGWIEIIQDVISALPAHARLSIWRHEDFAQLEDQILAEMTGPTVASRLNPRKQRPLQRPTAAAVAHLLGQRTWFGRLRQKDVRAALTRFRPELGYSPFCPWSDGEIAHMSVQYNDDVRSLRRWRGSIIMQPRPIRYPIGYQNAVSSLAA